MKLLDIKIYPDCILGKKAKEVPSIDDNFKDLIDNMAYTMYKTKGIGLAAPQVGILSRIIVYDIANRSKRSFNVLINPKILDTGKKTVSESEGCLSIPNFRSNVERFDEIMVEGSNINGKIMKIGARGILSIVLQHEIDHLNGTLLIDYVSFLKRNIYKKQLAKRYKIKK